MPFISSIRKKYESTPKNSILDHLEITGGDEIYTVGGYRIHLFTKTGDSEFSIKLKNPTNSDYLHLINQGATTVEYLVLAGGASGGKGIAGGGGAGGYREGFLPLAVGSTTPTTVGDGGAATPANDGAYVVGRNGGASGFCPISATGGGGGGTHNPSAPGGSGNSPSPGGGGNPGGSGGGGGGGGPSPYPGGGGGGAGTAGFRSPGNQTSAGTGIAGQGHPGGHGGYSSGDRAGNGGRGLASNITGFSRVRAGGGGGGNHSGPFGWGGPGFATDGGTGGNVITAAAPANSGSGSGGTGHSPNGQSGAGGSGLVVVRYPIL